MPAAVTTSSNAPEERPAAAGGTGSTPDAVNAEGGEDRMWKALKLYIARDRQRKRKEYEAEVEEERLRKEKEARQRQHVMTLEDTKEQIDQLEQKLKQLEKEKQQLFMQLKKVLNEDEIRKRQQTKENNDVAPMKIQMSNVQMPMLFPPTSTSQEQMNSQGRPPPLSSHILNKGNIQTTGVKRQRSPSPGPYPSVMYQHRIHHQAPLKHQPVYSDHQSQQHKVEDGRMARLPARAVLWNKPTQYNTTTSVNNAGAYYHLPTSGGVVGVVGDRPPPLLYTHHPHSQHSQHHGLMYTQPQQQIYMDIVKNQHHEKKEVQPQVLIGLSEPHHGGVGVSVAYNQPARHHVNVHSTMPMHTNQQTVKPGSITQGYPVRQPTTNVQSNMYPNRHRY